MRRPSALSPHHPNIKNENLIKKLTEKAFALIYIL
jgi:hypothetical protein